MYSVNPIEAAVSPAGTWQREMPYDRFAFEGLNL
jgi:hypothetical protein